MSHADRLALGDWNALCSLCGHKFKASELTKNWQGQYRCRRCQEPRHPQDFVKAIPEKEVPSWIQPRPSNTFVLFCTPNGMTAIADFAVADCATADYIHPAFDPTVLENI